MIVLKDPYRGHDSVVYISRLLVHLGMLVDCAECMQIKLIP
jgi:hypothetical protein